jgi:hypothetical protein
MLPMKQAGVGALAVVVAPLWLAVGSAVAQSIPASGRYQCAGANGAMAELNFTVGPGTIYTTPKGFRGTMSVHPGTGNVLFHVAPPQASYQGRYSPGPPPQVTLLTVTDGKSVETGVICQLR